MSSNVERQTEAAARNAFLNGAGQYQQAETVYYFPQENGAGESSEPNPDPSVKSQVVWC